MGGAWRVAEESLLEPAVGCAGGYGHAISVDRSLRSVHFGASPLM